MNNTYNVFWFRRDFRLNDNHGLFKACSGSLPVMAIFIFDPDILKEFPAKNDRRISFIFQSLSQIQKELNKTGGSLSIFYGKPVDIFGGIVEKHTIQSVYCNHDYEPAAIERDKKVFEFLGKKGISFITHKDQVIFEKNEIVTDEQKPYTVFTPYMKKWKKEFQQISHKSYPSEKLLHTIVNIPHSNLNPEIPGYQIIDFSFPKSHFSEELIRNYHHTRDFPAKNGTTQLGLHFRFGTVSIREAAQKAVVWNEVWLNELIWRDFFMQILWHFPHVTHGAFRTKYNFIQWRNDEQEFERFCNGETGYPLVDAGIHELLETGNMHNRVRMVVANFLTKLLLIDWQWGERFFAQHLLDYELASNNGNWQWSAGTGADAAPYFRIFNPFEQIRRFDPEYEYINQWNKNFSTVLKPIVDYQSARKRCLDTFSNLRIQ